MASLLQGSKPLQAQAIIDSVPEVDRVSVRVIVDSYQFAVADGKRVGPVDIEHFWLGP
jgi:7,8-dihydropterin-6-yl-methyl-4-(beta-D-ribofuranosyl)aminobenzene 5'-phosphate synthase